MDIVETYKDIYQLLWSPRVAMQTCANFVGHFQWC